MKRITAAAFAGLFLFAGVASAATPTQRIAKLEKQVKALQATVKKQQTTLTKQQKTINQVTAAAFTVDLCMLAATTDAIQSTWAALDQAMGTSVFGPQQTIGDLNACSDLQITRQGIRNPPNVSVFSAIIGLFSSGKQAFKLFSWLH